VIILVPQAHLKEIRKTNDMGYRLDQV
jgi:hypothetical protein